MAWVHGMTHRFLKIRTSHYRKFRIWEIREDKYTKRLAKNQVCAIIDMRDKVVLILRQGMFR